MKLTKKQQQVLKWTTRILALAILLFGLPFYFGYGNPLPFLNPDYTVWDNTWLTVFPLMFLGLALGWKYEKAGGYLIVIPLMVAFIIGLIVEGELVVHMLVPFAIGLLYLLSGYLQHKGK